MTGSIGAFCLKRDDASIKRRYATKLGPGLIERHGKKPFYTKPEIDDVIRTLLLPLDYSCWGYSLFLPRFDFDALHRATGETCDYATMRADMVGLIPVADPSWFDLASWIPDLGSITDLFDPMHGGDA